MSKSIRLVIAVSLLACAASAAHSQSAYPVRTVRIVVPLSTGSASDALARAIAGKQSESWGQQVVVENMLA